MKASEASRRWIGLRERSIAKAEITVRALRPPQTDLILTHKGGRVLALVLLALFHPLWSGSLDVNV